MSTRTGSWRRLHPAVRVVIVIVALAVVVNIALSLLDDCEMTRLRSLTCSASPPQVPTRISVFAP